VKIAGTEDCQNVGKKALRVHVEETRKPIRMSE